MKNQRIYSVIALATILLLFMPIGLSSVMLGIGLGDNPCILCWQERMAMMLISVTGLFIIRYGLRPKYLALMLFFCCFGIFMSLRHAGGHFLRDIGQGFALEVFGIHTYTWGVIVYWLTLLVIATILAFFGNGLVDNEDGEIRYITKFQSSSFVVFFFVLSVNAIQAFTQVGPPPFLGQGDPIRFSWDPKDWIWSTKKWNGLMAPLSFRGNYHVESPLRGNRIFRGIAMFENGDDLLKVKEVALPESIVGEVRDMDYNPQQKTFVIVTDKYYVYFLDSKLEKITAYVHLDPLYSISIKTLVGVTFISPTRVVVTGYNKSFIILKLDENAKIKDQYANFLEGSDGIREILRGRFSTVRAKYSYIRSLTWDRRRNELVSLTVPNNKNSKIIASNYSDQDYVLNSEKEVFVNDATAVPIITSLKVHNSRFYGLNADGKEIIISDNELAGFTGSIKLPQKANYKAMAVFDSDQFVIIDDKVAGFYINK